MLVETISAIGSSVTGAIRQAAEATGTGFSYLLATAKIESGLNPKVKASTSSATSRTTPGSAPRRGARSATRSAPTTVRTCSRSTAGR